MKFHATRNGAYPWVLFLLFSLLLFSDPTEAAVNLAWNPSRTNADGSPCTDLAGYKIYYDSDSSGPPYHGSGLNQGASPITIPLAALSDPSNPDAILSGFGAGKAYYVTVTAYDTGHNESGYSNEALIQGTTSPNQVPTARAGADQTIAGSQLAAGSVQVTLNGSLSSDPDGDPLTYVWAQTQGSPVNLMGNTTAGPFFSATSALSGQTLAFRLIVGDGKMWSGPDTVSIHVGSLSAGKNVPPSATIGAKPTGGMAPLTVSFSGTGTDTDGTVRNYTWGFGDGSSTKMRNPQHVYGAPGDYAATLTVTDDQGARNTARVMIRVQDPAPDLDTDADGFTDRVEAAQGLDPRSWDSDGDGLSDFMEWGPGPAPLDSEGDGIPDALDGDSDNDGKPDRQEGTGDDDGDGALNYVDMDDTDGPLGDQDGDGLNNSIEVTAMMNPNLPDSDGDSIRDGTEFGGLAWPRDSDGDGTIDALDGDSDNDGKPDSQEGTGDDDGDGAANYVDILDTDGPEGDQDGDGFINLRETRIGLNPNLGDSDQDGIPDKEEIVDISVPADTDGDGIIDALDPDSDNDGIPDRDESREDQDGDGLPDRMDAATATFIGNQGRMALNLLTTGCRLSEAKYIPEAISTDRWRPSRPFKYGGVQFKVVDVPEGKSVKVQIITEQELPGGTRYWKYEEATGYEKMDSWVRGQTLNYTLKDGHSGDEDHAENGEISDPGFIVGPGEQPADPPPAAPAGGGGGGCALGRTSPALPDGLLTLFPLLVPLIFRRMRKT